MTSAPDATTDSTDDSSTVDQPLADFMDAAPSSRGDDSPAPEDPAVTQQIPAVDADAEGAADTPTDATDAPNGDAPEADAPSGDEPTEGASGVGEAVDDPPVTQQMPVIDAPPPEEAAGADAPAAAEEPSWNARAAAAAAAITAAGHDEQAANAATPEADEVSAGAPGTNGNAAKADPTSSDAEPAVTQQMPVVDVPPIDPAPAPASPTETSSDGAYRSSDTILAAEPQPEAEVAAPVERPRHMRPSGDDIEKAAPPPDGRRRAIAIAAPAIVLILLIAAWAIDTATHSGQVLRNVELAGQSIAGVKEEDLPKVVSDIAETMAARKVTITSGDRTYESTAGELGLSVDQKATVESALDVGRGDSLLVRPVKWLSSFFSSRTAPLELSMSESQTAAMLQRLQGPDRTQPVEPQIQLAANGFELVPGKAGVGIDVQEVSKELREAALAEPSGPIKLAAETQDEAPAFSDRQAQALADRANELTAAGLTLKADDHTAQVPAQTLRGWLSQTVTDGKLDLAFNADAAKAALPLLLGGVSAEPKNATVTLTNGQPTVVPGQNGVECCGEDSGQLMWQALKDKKPEVALEATVKEPEFTTEEVTAWGIKGPVGGGRGYRDGAEIPSGLAPGFTTFHAPTGARNHNINKIADEVRGAVVPPGGEFSINDYVGKRTYADGYVDAGAIRNGNHVEEVGGGISQFATTMFNAAYFAGLDVLESQSHSEWFNRYPPGREATMGFPHPDVRIRNNTPYGLLIWTSHTATSVTVTFYSTPYAKAEQTGSSESMSGVCRVVVTTRTRTYPDGKTEQDQFRSTYRPEGKLCSGAAVPPPPPTG